MDAVPRKILTVSELTGLLRATLEQSFSDVWIEGELSNLRTPSSGHVYFTLKDAACQMRAVLFRTTAQRLKFALREGQQVIVRGRLTVYEARGDYQTIVEYVEPKGVGALQLAFEQVKERLAREGLFDTARKRPLPLLPARVGLVTSPTGAAIRDILTIIERRCPRLSVRIYPVPVQGEGAASRIAAAIRALGQTGDVDVIIVGRGGGSFEDLWCFNEEVVVRAIAGSPVPIVSAVGHETDVTLADFAADRRVSTPSAAAEAVAPVLDDLLSGIRELWARQERALRGRVRLIRHELAHHCRALPIFVLQVQRRAQQVDDAVGRLPALLADLVVHRRARALTYTHALSSASPLVRVWQACILVPQLITRLQQRMLGLLAGRRQALRACAGALDGLSPLNVLARGYAVLESMPGGRVIHRVRGVRPHDVVQARLADGRLTCDVREVLPDSS